MPYRSHKHSLRSRLTHRLESTWKLKPAFPHLANIKMDMLVEIQKALDYYESNNFESIKSKPGYVVQIIKTYRSLQKENGKFEDI